MSHELEIPVAEIAGHLGVYDSVIVKLPAHRAGLAGHLSAKAIQKLES